MSVTTKNPSAGTVMSTDAVVAEDEAELTKEERRQRQIELNKPVIALLQSWLEGDDEDEREQRETLEALKRGIDESRPPRLKLFS